MKLYEFSVMINCGVVVAADNEEAAKQAVGDLGVDGVKINSDMLEVSDIQLVDVREAKSDDLNDEAHLIARDDRKEQ